MQEPYQTRASAPILDLRGYLAVLRRRKWSILFITAIAVGSALAFSFRQTPIYESTAVLQVVGLDPSLPVIMETEQKIAQGTEVALLAAEDLGGTDSPQALLADLSVSVPTNAQILEITYADPDPATAKAGAEAFANAYLQFKRDQWADALAAERQAVGDRIERLKNERDQALAVAAAAEPDSPERLEAETDAEDLTLRISYQQNQLDELIGTSTVPGYFTQHALLPTEPAAPNHYMNGGLAFLLGLALGVGLAFLRERLDDRIAGREDFEEAVGAPTLAVVPKVTGWRKRSRAELPALKSPKGAPAEAFRTVRTNLLFMSKDGDIKTVVVTSPASGEGKTTTAANLAVSLAQAEKRVIVVSCDLRKPRLHQFFSLTNDIGVTSVVTGKATLGDAILKPVGTHTLRVVPSGPVPHNPAEILASDRMTTLLQQLRRVADFVIIDTPPTLAVSDGLTLAPRVDGVILVADATSTSRGAIRHLREQLEQVGGHILGGVFNNFDPSRAKYYASYGTYYGYPYEAQESRRRRKEPEPPGPSPQDIWKTEDIWR